MPPKTKRNVYVVNKSNHDFSLAERHGELKFLSEGLLRKRNVNFMARKFLDELRDSRDEDFVLPTSLTIMSIVACVCFVMKHCRLNLLIFDEGSYKVRTLNFDQRGELLNNKES